jgi:outer membrane murein-binding lipoprotein Lpp
VDAGEQDLPGRHPYPPVQPDRAAGHRGRVRRRRPFRGRRQLAGTPPRRHPGEIERTVNQVNAKTDALARQLDALAAQVAALSTQHDELAAQVAQLQADMNLVKTALGIP